MYGKRYHLQRKRNLRNANSTTPHREVINTLKNIDIVAVGYELLPGNAVGTNTNWLCTHISFFGGKVM